MGQFVVIKELEWKPPVQSKLLKVPVVKISAIIDDDKELTEMVTKQRQAFDAEFKKFDADFTKLGTQKIKVIQDAIKFTEERIVAKSDPKEREKVVEGANQLLKQAFLTFQQEIQALLEKHFKASVEKSQKVMKMKITKSRAKAVAKIVIVGLLILTALGLSIAATVVTGGAAAPIAVAVVLGSLKAAYSMYQNVTTNWNSATNQMKLISEDVSKLTAATKTLEEQKALATTGSTGAMDKVRKAKAAVDGQLVSLDKHVGQLDKYIFQTSQSLKKQNDKLNEMMVEINKGNDPKLKKSANDLSADIMKSIGELRAMSVVTEQAAEIRKAWENQEKIVNLGRFGGALRTIAEVAPFILQMKAHLTNIQTEAKKIA